MYMLCIFILIHSFTFQERILSHPSSAYAAAIRLCEAHDKESAEENNPLDRNAVGYTFERTWQDIFGAPRCQFKWSGCRACPGDCGSCKMDLEAPPDEADLPPGAPGDRRYISC
jgi:hypothetical protein